MWQLISRARSRNVPSLISGGWHHQSHSCLGPDQERRVRRGLIKTFLRVFKAFISEGGEQNIDSWLTGRARAPGSHAWCARTRCRASPSTRSTSSASSGSSRRLPSSRDTVWSYSGVFLLSTIDHILLYYKWLCLSVCLSITLCDNNYLPTTALALI